ncbi:YadA-like family protein [Megasphaera massiliensis]
MDDGLNFTGDTAGVTVAKKLNETLSITGGITKADQLTTEDNIGVVASNSGLKVRLAKDLQDLNSVRIGGTTANGEGIYIANQTGVKTTTGKDEDDGLYITGLTNTTWNPKANGYVSGRAATEDQLNSVYETINSNIESSKAVSGKNITVDKDNKVNLNDEITLGDAASNNVAISGTNGTITAGDGGSNQVAIDGTKSTITAGTGDNKVTVDGNSGMVTVGDTTKGAISIGNQTVTPKVVGTDGTETDGTAKTGKYITGLENTTWNPTGEGYVADRAATEGQLKNVADNISKQISDIDTAVKSTSRVFESDSGADAQVTRKSTDPMKLKGGATGELSDGNIGVVNNSDKTGFDIKLSKDIKGLNSIEVNNKITIGTGDNQTIIEGDTINTGSVTTGNTTINNEGLTIVNEDSSKNITINNNNVNMGGNVIKNIGEGSEPTDAINKTQFDRAINNLGTGMNQINNRVNKLDNRVNRVGAGAAALAALHPLEFSPDAKWEVTAGVGNYRGANAIALGAFYRPNFDTMFSIGTSYGGGENMINAGVTWRIGEGETKAYPSKTVMAQEIDDLKTVVSEQQDQIEELKKLVNSLINK